MVVGNLPPLGKLLQDQSESTASSFLLFVFHFLENKFELPANHRGIWRENLDVEITEGEFSHLLAVGLIALHIAFLRFLPAKGDVATGNERELVVIPVTRHEAIEIALVPCNRLSVEDSSNILFGRAWIVASTQPERYGRENNADGK